MPLVDQNVVHQAVMLQHLYSSVEITAHDEVVVRLVLDDMPDGLQLRVGRERFQNARDFWVGQRRPSHYTANEGIRSGESEKPIGLLHGLAGLNGNHSLDTHLVDLFFEVRRQKIAADNAL